MTESFWKIFSSWDSSPNKWFSTKQGHSKSTEKLFSSENISLWSKWEDKTTCIGCVTRGKSTNEEALTKEKIVARGRGRKVNCGRQIRSSPWRWWGVQYFSRARHNIMQTRKKQLLQTTTEPRLYYIIENSNNLNKRTQKCVCALSLSEKNTNYVRK